jgi:endonuclease/exonuclease/phosphatase (EEP) superfamily protein YafD
MNANPWRQYRHGAKVWLALLLGQAGKANGPYPLEAGITGAFLAGIVTNAALLLAWDATRPAGIAGIVVAGAGVYYNRGGVVALRGAKRGGRGVRIMTWNVEYRNDPANVAAGVAAGGGELVVLFEPVVRQLDAVGKVAPAHVRCEAPGDGGERHSGIAAYGGERVTKIEWRDVGGMSAVRCDLTLNDGKKVAVWGYRPQSPTSKDLQKLWSGQLDALEALLAKETLPVVLVGDLNSTVWHEPFHRLVTRRGLRRASPLIGGTWKHELLGWRGRIDHIYVDQRIRVARSRRESAWGSDHRPLTCEIVSVAAPDA